MLTDMTLGQYYPGHSYLHQMDPRAKILCTMIFIVAIFLANNLYSYIVVAGFTFLAIALSGVPAKMIWKAIKPLWVILVSPCSSTSSPPRGRKSFRGNSSTSAKKASGTASS